MPTINQPYTVVARDAGTSEDQIALMATVRASLTAGSHYASMMNVCLAELDQKPQLLVTVQTATDLIKDLRDSGHGGDLSIGYVPFFYGTGGDRVRADGSVANLAIEQWYTELNQVFLSESVQRFFSGLRLPRTWKAIRKSWANVKPGREDFARTFAAFHAAVLAVVDACALAAESTGDSSSELSLAIGMPAVGGRSWLDIMSSFGLRYPFETIDAFLPPIPFDDSVLYDDVPMDPIQLMFNFWTMVERLDDRSLLDKALDLLFGPSTRTGVVYPQQIKGATND